MTSESVTTADHHRRPSEHAPASRRTKLRIALSGVQLRLGAGYLARIRRDPTSRLLLASGRANPYPVYRRIRQAGPLTRSRTGTWVSASHAVVQQVVRDRRFGTRQVDEVPPAPDAHARAVLGEEWDASFLTRDPPDHTRLRRLAAPAFTPKRIAAYEPLIERVTHRLVDQALEGAGRRSGFDLMGALAAPLPVTVISALLGLEHEDIDRLTAYGNVLAASLDGVTSLRLAYDLQRTLGTGAADASHPAAAESGASGRTDEAAGQDTRDQETSPEPAERNGSAESGQATQAGGHDQSSEATAGEADDGAADQGTGRTHRTRVRRRLNT